MRKLTEEEVTILRANVRLSVIFDAIAEERIRQDKLWGKEVHPMIGRKADEVRPLIKRFADSWKKANSHSGGGDAWYSILLEEVYEALSEADRAKQRVELVQVAAVVVKIIEAIDNGSLMDDSNSVVRQPENEPASEKE